MQRVEHHTEYRWFQATEKGVARNGGICHE
jgi:hypothetical protein